MEVFGNPVADAYVARFPRHGWAEDVEGEVSLFFPVLTVLEHAHEIRLRAGLHDAPDPLATASFKSFLVHVRSLALVLCELETLVHHHSASVGLGRNSVLERAPELLDRAFTSLRRLADRLACAVNPMFFQHRASSPRRFASLIKIANSEGPDEDLLVPGIELRSLLRDQIGWFRRLRGDRGLRDLLEHHPVQIDVALVAGSTSSAAGMVAGLSAGPEDDLVIALREICAGLCEFLTGVCAMVRYTEAYRYGDDLNVVNTRAVLGAFWPEI